VIDLKIKASHNPAQLQDFSFAKKYTEYGKDIPKEHCVSKRIKSSVPGTRKARQPVQAPPDSGAPPLSSQSTNTPAAPKKRQYLPAHERRRLIIQAAQKVFASTSLQGARTRDLARAAEVNQATLFEHFGSKEDLFLAAVVQPLTELLQGMRERVAHYKMATSEDEMLTLAQMTTKRHLDTMTEIYPLLVQALFSDQALGEKLYREQIVPLIKVQAEALRPLVKEGLDPEVVNLAVFGMFFGIAMDRAFTGNNDDLPAIARQVTSLALFGFTPRDTPVGE
jgi:AcrR family transcriptional regulator